MKITESFVPASLAATSWDAVRPYYDRLLAREVGSADELERWLVDRSELIAACSEEAANRYIAMTCDTASKEKQAAYLEFVEGVEPEIKKAAFKLDGKQAELSRRFGLESRAGGRYRVICRDTEAAVTLFREENVPLQTELDKLSQQYQQVIGAMSVDFDGQSRTLPQMARYQESQDRAVRESAWRATAERRLRDKDAINDIYDKQVALRVRVAANAGFPTFTAYAFKAMRRFDYTPDHCRAFHDACERVVVPFARAQQEKRRMDLRVDALRPWDLSVDPKGREPLRPFEGGVDLVRKTSAMFGSMDAGLREMFDELGDGSNTNGSASGASLDLDSRAGKAPGGYQYMRDRMRKPFIFMNAAGMQHDVETMIHEAGHAFHSMLCRTEPLAHYRDYPTEFAEVASMSMELLTMPHWQGERMYYQSDEDAARARRKQVEGSVSLLPWIATIDAFQHWVFGNPAHTREQREAFWLELDRRFGAAVSWDGLDEVRRNVWHRQSHLFVHPFYYIEYGIAQLGALGLWLVSLEKGEAAALSAYKRAMTHGGSRPLPELFEAAGLRFDFGYDTVARIVDRVSKELEKLPE